MQVFSLQEHQQAMAVVSKHDEGRSAREIGGSTAETEATLASYLNSCHSKKSIIYPRSPVSLEIYTTKSWVCPSLDAHSTKCWLDVSIVDPSSSSSFLRSRSPWAPNLFAAVFLLPYLTRFGYPEQKWIAIIMKAHGSGWYWTKRNKEADTPFSDITHDKSE